MVFDSCCLQTAVNKTTTNSVKRESLIGAYPRVCLSYCVRQEIDWYTSDYDCILAMLLGSSRNGRLEVTQFSVSTSSGTVSVIWRDAKSNTSRLAAPGSLGTCPIVRMAEVSLQCAHDIIVFEFRS